MKQIIKENIIKNIIMIVVIIAFYFPIKTYLEQSNIANDPGAIGNLLFVTSIIIVTACFGAFAFTYERVKIDKFSHRLLAHITTGLLILIIGLSLTLTSMLITYTIGYFFIFDLILVLLYIAVVCYDFWDLLRLEIK